MTGRHIVWDWNGTLLDDVEIVIAAVNAGLVPFGAGPIDTDAYRTHYTRPVRLFYEQLLGRTILDPEWLRLDDLYFEAYQATAATAALAPDATAALSLAQQKGADQSLLSMAPHEHLIPIVDQHRLTPFFREIRGTSGDRGGAKATILADHLATLEVAAGDVIVVGDTPDDAAAAAHVGAGAVLYDGGSHHRTDLERVGVPVVSTLSEAVELAVR